MESNTDIETCPFGCGAMLVGYKFLDDKYGAKLLHCAKCKLKFEIPSKLEDIEADIKLLTILAADKTTNPSQYEKQKIRYTKHLELLHKALIAAKSQGEEGD